MPVDIFTENMVNVVIFYILLMYSGDFHNNINWKAGDLWNFSMIP